MTPAQADALALAISQTWRSGPPVNIWSDELVELNYNQAEAAYRQLRREAEHAPAISRFLLVYHSLTKPEPVWRTGQPEVIVSFGEYLTTLVAKADDHDFEANEMLDIWADNERRGLSTTDIWKRP